MAKPLKISNQNHLDDLDYEIDEMLKMVRSGKFKDGIYNFCDRWCEKCKDQEKCFLFAQEMQRKVRHLLDGKDSNDWETIFEDIKHSFAITRRLIERGLREQGLDPKKILEESEKNQNWDDAAEKRYDKISCLVQAKEYMKKTFSFLKDFHENRFQYYADLGMEISYHDVYDEIETINWYHTLLPVKIWRVLYEKESLKKEKDKELKKLMERDFKKYCALVIKCLTRSKRAWKSLAKKRKELNKKILKFIILLDKIENEFRQIF